MPLAPMLFGEKRKQAPTRGNAYVHTPCAPAVQSGPWNHSVMTPLVFDTAPPWYPVQNGELPPVVMARELCMLTVLTHDHLDLLDEPGRHVTAGFYADGYWFAQDVTRPEVWHNVTNSPELSVAAVQPFPEPFDGQLL